MRRAAISLLMCALGCECGSTVSPDAASSPDASLADAAAPTDAISVDTSGARVDATFDANAFDANADAPLTSMPCTASGACDPFSTTACGAGMACRPGAMAAPTMCAPTAAATVAIGATCTSIDQCPTGSQCLNFGGGAQCERLCPMGSIGACGSGAACSGTITGGDPCIRVCRPLPAACNIYTQDCADPMLACSLYSHPETGIRGTACRAPGAGTLGAACGGMAGGCGRGLLCLGTAGASTCRQVCDAEAAVSGCPDGAACTGTVTGWGITFCATAG